MSYLIKAISILHLAAFPLMVPAQSNRDGTMPQYLFTEFSNSEVLMKNGQKQDPMMNYNTVTGMMVFVRDNKYYDLTNPEMVDTIYLQDRKFIPAGKMYYEVLAKGSVDLFTLHEGVLMSAGTPVGYGGTSQVSSSNYLSNIKLEGGEFNMPIPADYIVKVSKKYLIRKGDEWLEFTNEKQIIKLFPDKADQLRKFIKENRIRFDRPDNVARLAALL